MAEFDDPADVPPDVLLAAQSALAAACQQGCSCDVEIEIEQVGECHYQAVISHDDWCPVLKARAAQWN